MLLYELKESFTAKSKKKIPTLVGIFQNIKL